MAQTCTEQQNIWRKDSKQQNTQRKPSAKNCIKVCCQCNWKFKDIHLSDFFRKIAYRKGRATVVSATARKLGVIIWKMITKKLEYKPPTEYLFLDQKRKLKLVKRIGKNISKFDLKLEDIGFATT